jgi:AraC-like DNA-binding protein
MQYFSIHPAAPLDEFVDVFWVIQRGDTDRRERILPCGSIELVVNMHQDEIRIYDSIQPERHARFSGAVVSGTYSRAFTCDAKQHRSIVGVHFKPGGAWPFFGLPVVEMSNTHFNLDDLWGPAARIFRARLCEASTIRSRFQIIEKALVEHWQQSPKRHPAIQSALRLFGPTGTSSSTRDVARKLGMCQRRFIHLFAENFGLTPKLLCRIRFQHARTLAEMADRCSGGWMARYREGAALDWAQTAIACGYYDQSHLIREFQNLSGLSPSEYIRQLRPARGVKDNHVPVPR